MNPDIFETAYSFSRIRVNRVLNHSGKWFEKAGCGFNERILGFHVNGRSIRGKKKKRRFQKDSVLMSRFIGFM